MYSVLYVDDEAVLLDLGKMFLEMSGTLRVDTAISAARAIEFLKDRPVDCIVSDYQMPEMDGIEFLKYIRKNHGLLPFILFTGRGREEIAIEAFSNAADFYLQKGGDPRAQFVELEHKVKLAIERRKTQDELKESRQRMADIIDHLPDGTFAIDLEHRVIAWNLAMEEMTGVKKEDIVGSTDQSYAIPFYGVRRPLLLDLILKDDPEIAKEYPRITRKGNKLISELYLQRLYGGRGAYLWFIASPLYDTEGRVIGAIESIRDVTDPHRAQDELQVSRERYRAVVEDQTEFISRFLPDGTHTFVNEAYCRYFGKTPQEIIGTRFRPEIYPEDGQKIRDHLKSLTPDHPEAMLEHRIIMPDGKVRWHQWSDRAIFDENGNVREYQSVGRDITDQKQAEDELRLAYENLTAAEEQMRAQFEELKFREEALRTSERKLQDIVRGSPIPQFVIDQSHTVISWNHALEMYTGIRAEDIIGTQEPWKAFYPVKRPVLADLVLDNSRDGIEKWYSGKYSRSVYVEGAIEVTDFFPKMGKNGTWLFFTASVLRDARGSVIGAVETLEDVTAIKNKEDELRKAYEELTAAEEELRAQFEELKHREEALRTSERKLQDIVRGSPIPQFVIDKDHKVISWNHALEMYSGIRAEEVIGTEGPWKAFYPKRRPVLADLVLDNSIEGIETWYGGKFSRSKYVDGAVEVTDFFPKMGRNGTWLFFTASVIRDTHGSVIGAVETLEDVTGIKKKEEELRESEDKYRRILADMQDTYYRSDREGNLIMISPSGVRLLGYDSDTEMLGRPIAATFYHDAHQRELFLAAIAKDGVVTGMEIVLKRRDGTPVTVSTNSHRYYDQEGNFLGVEGTFRDITGQKQSDKVLLEKEEQYRSLFESTGTAMVLIEENTIISLPNAEFIRMTGYTREEIAGKMSWTALVVKEDLDRMLAQHQLRREQREAALRNYDFRLKTKNGDIRNIYLTVDIIPGTKQSVASLMDITEKVRAQEALKLANRKLNLLNRITRHDVLNQLTSLFGFLELVQRKVTDPAVLQYLERERRAAESIRSHIEFTKDYQEVGIQAPEWQRVRDVITKAGESVSMKGVMFRNDVGDVEIYADLLLQKVFYTLIDNALRHGGTVTEIRFSMEEGKDGLVISCSDNGTGVPQDAKKKIFQRKYYQNTGLGLFLSQEILSITGLTMRETGIHGKGARFEIHVPRDAFRHPQPPNGSGQ